MTVDLSALMSPQSVILNLAATSKDAALEELVASLEMEEDSHLLVRRLLDEREAKGSTGVGEGVAIPHARCDDVDTLMIAYGRSTGGIDWDALDGLPVHHVFLIVAPPVHVSNEYLKVMGEVARLVRDEDVRNRLDKVDDREEFMKILTEA